MNITNKRLLSLVSAELLGHPIEIGLFQKLTVNDWKLVLQLSAPHSVQGFCIDAVKHYLPVELQPPKMVMLTWLALLEDVEKKYNARFEAIEQLSRLFASHGIRMMLLKGAGVASYYPIPQHRWSSDIDFYVFGEKDLLNKHEEADRIVAQTLGIEYTKSYHYHTSYTFEGVLLENHYDFINTHSHKSNISFEKHLKKLSLEQPFKEMSFGESKVVLPSANFNALFLMKHLAAHFAAKEVGLKNVCDWGMFLVHESDNIDFDLIENIFKSYNLQRFANAVNTILVEMMGMDSALLKGHYYKDEQLAESVITEVLEPQFPRYTNTAISNPFKSIHFRTKRFLAGKWKHDLVYRDGFYSSMLRSAFAHLREPRTLIK